MKNVRNRFNSPPPNLWSDFHQVGAINLNMSQVSLFSILVF